MNVSIRLLYFSHAAWKLEKFATFLFGRPSVSLAPDIWRCIALSSFRALFLKPDIRLLVNLFIFIFVPIALHALLSTNL